MKLKRKVATDIQWFLTSTVLITIFNFVRNIVSARLLGPYLTGLCLSLITIPQLASYLGLSDVLTVSVPYNKEKGNNSYAREITNTIFNYALYMSIFLFIIICTYAIAFQSGEMRLFVILATSLIILWELKRFFVADYSADKQFKKLSWIEFFFALATLLASCLLIYYWMGYGFWLGLIIPNAMFLWYFFYASRKKRHVLIRKIDYKQVMKIIPMGIVMLLSSVVYSPFVITAKLFIVATVGAKAVGLFVLSIIVISKMSIIPKTISSVLMPHMSSIHGGAASRSNIFELFLKSQLLTLALTVLVAIPAWFLIEPVVSAVLPSYIPGVPAAKIMLIASIPYCLIYNANNVLIALQHKRVYMKILVAVIVLQFVLYGILLFYGITIKNISEAFCVLFFSYTLLANYKIVQMRKNGILMETPEGAVMREPLPNKKGMIQGELKEEGLRP